MASVKFPDLLPDTSTMYKKWIWREETNSLEQISTGLQTMTDRQMLNLSKAKQTNRNANIGISNSTPVHLKSKRSKKQFVKQSKIVSPKPSVKIHSSENRAITLADVKGVSFDLLSENGEIPESFQASLRSNHFDGLLIDVLCYFETFFDKLEFENRPKTMALEPSAAQKKDYQIAIRKLEIIQKKLAEKYCHLILGLENELQHHLARGKQRKSYTFKDRLFYEAFYSFSCYVIWVCFRRNSLELIQKELGRLFRSQAFNPFGRPADEDEFRLASDLTTDEIHGIKLAPSFIKKNKRPPIKSIINQRSPVLVSLLPNSKESAEWLLDRRKGLMKPKRTSLDEEQVLSINTKDDIRVGIIGEMISGFNPFTLAPFGDDNDELEKEETTDADGMETLRSHPENCSELKVDDVSVST